MRSRHRTQPTTVDDRLGHRRFDVPHRSQVSQGKVSRSPASVEPVSADGHATLSSSELARLTGVSTDTLRHYERKRVLPRPTRLSNGYRRYPAEAAVRVHLIQRALQVGFSLDELARSLGERERGGVPCRRVRALVADRLAEARSAHSRSRRAWR